MLLYLQLYTTACFSAPVLVGLGAMAFVEFILPFENLLILQGLRQLKFPRQGENSLKFIANATKPTQVRCGKSLRNWLRYMEPPRSNKFGREFALPNKRGRGSTML